MQNRRILSLWFPRLGAERLLRLMRAGDDVALAVVQDVGNMQLLSSVSVAAQTAGISQGQPLRDALAVCPTLITRPQNTAAEVHFVSVLQRWAGKFSPWIATANLDALHIDLTGCAHLFGGEEGVMSQVSDDCLRMQLSVQMGVADTLGTAWALARYANQPIRASQSGDAIDQEARATRARAVKRRNWERGGAAPKVATLRGRQQRISAPGQARTSLAPLPIAALRLPDAMVTELNRLGLRRIQDLTDQPRGPLARRFGQELTHRLDQALGHLGEPISPARPTLHFACRMTLPEPIGLEEDVMGVIDRILPRLEASLSVKTRGARHLRLEAYKTDQTMQAIDVRLARPSAGTDRIRPLLKMRIGDIDAGFGIDMLRLVVVQHEALNISQRHTNFDRGQEAIKSDRSELDDLIGKLGGRIGLEAITRLHPSSSHIPEKASMILAAAWSQATYDWPSPTRHRPLVIFEPEMVSGYETSRPPPNFKWRGQKHLTKTALGPERLSPEWWLDERSWRTGTRDYWQITTLAGEQLWLYYAHGAAMSAGWFCHGRFA